MELNETKNLLPNEKITAQQIHVPNIIPNIKTKES